MTTMGEVPVDPMLLKLATELGFADFHQIHRHFGLSPLFYARWKGAPIGISHQAAIEGHRRVAFYKGKVPLTPEEIIEGGRSIKNRWDEILDTGSADPAALLVSAKAMLDFRAEGREIRYRVNPMPDMAKG
jgi:hypothetical protein